MTPETAQPIEPQPEGMSEISRITGVFFEPGRAFADIARRPAFIVPLILVMVCALAVTFTFGRHIGWDRMMRQQLEMSSRTANLSAEQKEQAVQMQAKIAPIGGAVAIVIGLPLYYVAAAGVLLGIMAMMSAKVRFKQVLAVMCYASLTGIVSSFLIVVVMFLKDPDQFNLQNPLVFNPAAFMDQQATSKFLYSVASSLDLFSIWTIILVAIGLKAAAGRTISFAGALTAVIIPWAVFVLVKSALAGLFS
jgi:hypothetical protein